MVRCCILHFYLIETIVFNYLYKFMIIFLFYKYINIVMSSCFISNKRIYTPTAVKEYFNLRIRCKSDNLFCICYTDHIFLP